MKKTLWLALILLFICVFAFSACDSGNTPQTPNDTPSDTTDNTTESETDAHIHTFGEWITIKDATCTVKGEQERSCSCGEKETQSIDAIGHTEVIDAAVAATCTTEGKTEGKHCSVCGETILAQTAIGKLDHTEVVDAAVAATCTTDGKTEGKHCSVCGDILVKQKNIEKNSHEYKNGLCKDCQYIQPDSEGLLFSSYGNGTCCVISIGSCKDQNIKIPNVSPDGDEVVAIYNKAFEDQNIINVVFPDTLQKIGYGAFWGCPIKELTLPKNLKVIEDYAFVYTKIESIAFNIGLESIGMFAFAHTNLVSVDIPNSVTKMNSHVFYNCQKLKNINLGTGITELSVSAFYQNYSLETIVLPDSIVDLSYRVFEKCIGLQSITIGVGVKTIKDNTFAGCSSLRVIYYSGSKAEWDSINKDANWDADLINCIVIFKEN